jgi:predicted alpha/beta hydrolase family esterase
MDDLRVSGDTTTMQVVQHTLGCASAAKWIDAFR